MKFGMGIQIGDGRHTRIWGDKWLPSIERPQIQSLPPFSFEEATVQLLLNEDGKSWNLRQLEFLFSPDETDDITKIHLPWSEQVDSFYWRFEHSGTFSVKSCYYALINRNPINALPSNYANLIWNNIWNLNLPARVTLFMWKVATNCLWTLERLRQRQVQIDPLCSLCGNGMESSYHALVTCPFAIMTWSKIFYGS